MAAAAAPGRGPAEQALSLCHPRERGATMLCLGSAKVIAASGSWPGTPQLARPPSPPALFGPGSNSSPLGLKASSPFGGAFFSPHLTLPSGNRCSSVTPQLGSLAQLHSSPGPDRRMAEGWPSPGFESVPCLPTATGHRRSCFPGSLAPLHSVRIRGQQSPGAPSQSLGRETLP